MLSVGRARGSISGSHHILFRIAISFALVHMKLLCRIDRGIGERHELVQHRKLKLQLDAVNHSLEGSFDLVIFAILHHQKNGIHTDDYQIDPDQLHHDFACPSMINRAE